jgi:hypothetical protein
VGPVGVLRETASVDRPRFVASNLEQGEIDVQQTVVMEARAVPDMRGGIGRLRRRTGSDGGFNRFDDDVDR